MPRKASSITTTGKLLGTHKEAIIKEVTSILQRPRGCFKSPLTIPDFIALHHSNFERESIDGARILVKYGHTNSYSNFTNCYVLKLKFPHTVLSTQISSYQPNFFRSDKSKQLADHPGPISEVDYLKAAEILQFQNLVPDFVVWHKQIEDANTAGIGALIVLSEVIEMATSAGQLARMVPELVTCLPQAHQQIYMARRKESSYPKAWARTERGVITQALDWLTKCALMEKVEYRAENEGLYFLKFVSGTDTFPIHLTEVK